MKKQQVDNPRKQKRNDHIWAIGNSLFMVTLLKGVVLVLSIALVAESIFVVTLLGKVAEVKPLPIFVDREAGTARPVDFSVIDAEGSKRVDAEINDFARDYVTNIYTFTRYTVETNLRRVLDLTADEARNQVQDSVIRSKRNEALSSGYQGVCDIKSISILDAGQTSTRVQVVFVAKQIGFQAMDSSRKAVATITMKTVLRQRNNAHGLYVVEYRESDIKE